MKNSNIIWHTGFSKEIIDKVFLFREFNLDDLITQPRYQVIK